MNFKKIILSTSLCVFLFLSVSLFAQTKDLRDEVGILATIASKSTLPFWFVSNKDGLIPNKNSIFSDDSLGMGFNEKSGNGNLLYSNNV